MVWTAGRKLALPYTLSRITPLELLTRKTTVEILQNLKNFFAKYKTSPRLECKTQSNLSLMLNKKESTLPQQPLWNRFNR